MRTRTSSVVRFPAQHFGVEEQLGAGCLGRIEVGLHAIFDEQVAGVRLEDGVQVLRARGGRAKRRSTSAAVSRSTGKSVFGGGPEDAGHDDAVRRADFDEADLVNRVGGRAAVPVRATGGSFRTRSGT